MKPRFKLRRNLGVLKLHNANAIYPSGLKLRIDRGKVYLDLDTLEETPNYPGGDYLHFGVAGKVKVEKVSSENVKGHIDFYVPVTEIDDLIEMLIGLKVGTLPSVAVEEVLDR